MIIPNTKKMPTPFAQISPVDIYTNNNTGVLLVMSLNDCDARKIMIDACVRRRMLEGAETIDRSMDVVVLPRSLLLCGFGG